MIKITAISIKYTDATGKPFHDSYGNKDQAKVAIQTDSPKYQGQWMSYFAPLHSEVLNWKVGDVVEVIVTEKGQFINFKPSKASPAIIERFRVGATRPLAGSSGEPPYIPPSAVQPFNKGDGIGGREWAGGGPTGEQTTVPFCPSGSLLHNKQTLEAKIDQLQKNDEEILRILKAVLANQEPEFEIPL